MNPFLLIPFLFLGGLVVKKVNANRVANAANGAGAKGSSQAKAFNDAKDARSADTAFHPALAAAVAAASAALVSTPVAVAAGGTVAAFWDSQTPHQKAQIWRGEV
jgi:hypothetical protein